MVQQKLMDKQEFNSISYPTNQQSDNFFIQLYSVGLKDPENKRIIRNGHFVKLRKNLNQNLFVNQLKKLLKMKWLNINIMKLNIYLNKTLN